MDLGEVRLKIADILGFRPKTQRPDREMISKRHFGVNTEATRVARTKLLNPDASSQSINPAKPKYLVEKDEVVASFEGQPEDFTSLVLDYQDAPLVKLMTINPTFTTKDVDGNTIHLRRTGLHIIRAHSPSKNIIQPKNAEELELQVREEIAGVQRLGNGSYQVFKINGRYSSWDLPKGSENEALTELWDKFTMGEINPVDFALMHPSTQNKNALRAAHEFGAIFFRYSGNEDVSDGLSTYVGAGEYYDRIVAQSRIPDASQLISRDVLTSEFFSPDGFKKFVSQLVVPARIATNPK